jgi:4-amino-4-deoxy-L-arabinose transferase-like glycosyltransferase
MGQLVGTWPDRGSGPCRNGPEVCDTAGLSTTASWKDDRRVGATLDRLASRPLYVFAGLLALYVAVTYLTSGSLLDRTDEPGYLGFAERLTHGGYAVRDGNPTDFLWRGPGLPLLLSPLVAIGTPVELMRLLGPLLLAGSAYLLFRLLRTWTDDRVALVGAVAFGLYFPLWRTLPRLFTEPLALALITGSMLLFIRGARRPAGGYGHVVSAGLLLGFLVLVRVENGYAVIATLVICGGWWLVDRGSAIARKGVTLAAVAFAVTVPWLVYTHHETDKWLYWGNSGGLSLYWMASPFSQDLGEPHTDSQVATDANLARHRPFFAALPTEPVARDEALRKSAKTQIREHPARYARNLAANFSRLWIHWPYSFGQGAATLLLFAVPGLLLFALVVSSIAVLIRRRTFDVALVPFAIFSCVAFAVHLAAAGYPRSIWPLVPFMAILATLAWEARRTETPR